MGHYRKKPVVIEARQIGNDCDEDLAIMRWAEGSASGIDEGGKILFCIDTLEGRMAVEPGDWVIRGVKGEFYPCKPDIFEATYEQAD